MICKGCGQEIDELCPLEKETFPTTERVTEVVCGVFVDQEGKEHLVLKDAYVETFKREDIYKCGYCDIIYTEKEIISMFKGGLDAYK